MDSGGNRMKTLSAARICVCKCKIDCEEEKEFLRHKAYSLKRLFKKKVQRLPKDFPMEAQRPPPSAAIVPSGFPLVDPLVTDYVSLRPTLGTRP
ncbi:hypothetical protein SK128_026389 [Halocaridina rubra]|uniref:Uncharacterized protein n=1 Tax=Halocaridina rubra TaxID=373956 RepID=A0AAN8XF34_HALRR